MWNLFSTHARLPLQAFLPPPYTHNAPWENPCKGQRGDTASVRVGMEEQHGKLDPTCILPFTESSICYPVKDFEDLNYAEGSLMQRWSLSPGSPWTPDLPLGCLGQSRTSQSSLEQCWPTMTRSFRTHTQRYCWIC